MNHKKIVDVREANVKRKREWEFAQANYSEAAWLMANFHSTGLNKEILVKSIFKDWYGDWVEFKVGFDEKGEAFLHDDGRYLALLEENHMDIYPEVMRQFFERHSKQVEDMQGFILKQTGCQDKSLLRFIIQMQQYCLALAELSKVVIEVDQASKLKVDDEVEE